MITPEEEIYILTKAYVPEHVVSLMALISKADPFLMEDHLGFAKDNWLILVGYPLDGGFSRERCERIVSQVADSFRPEILWFIGPEFPSSLLNSCKERETDDYYTLNIEQTRTKGSLRREVDKVSGEMTVEREHVFSEEHAALTAEFLKRATLPDRMRELYHAMPDYIGRSSSAWMLSARGKAGRLCAFSVVDLGAKDFSTYVLGAHSKKPYVPHASDLLFLDMINLTRENGKKIIHLGLGVNQGIRRFKEKWGGKPTLRYEFCECRYGTARKASLLDALMGKRIYRNRL